MFSLPLLERVADNRVLMGAAICVLVLSQYNVMVCSENVKKLNAGLPPDMRFGYTPKELNDWFDALGRPGCEVYKAMYRWDLFPFMQAYGIVLGSLLLQAAKKTGMNPNFAMIFPLAAGLDFLETIIPAYGCEIHPHRLPEFLILVAIGANQFKWISFVSGLVLLSVLWLYAMMKPEHPTSESGQASKGGTSGSGRKQKTKSK
jgi:hypothetical protein